MVNWGPNGGFANMNMPNNMTCLKPPNSGKTLLSKFLRTSLTDYGRFAMAAAVDLMQPSKHRPKLTKLTTYLGKQKG
jgi:hypothetical protein